MMVQKCDSKSNVERVLSCLVIHLHSTEFNSNTGFYMFFQTASYCKKAAAWLFSLSILWAGMFLKGLSQTCLLWNLPT